MKNTLKLLLIGAILWFPTFEPSDIITLTIINTLGIQLYIILSIIFAIILYKNMEGNTIKQKITIIKKEVKGWFR